jgi:fibronectin type 3 domain-containing protein
VTAISTSGAGIGVSGTSTSFTLASGQSNTFTVTFTPSSSGSVSGTVYLTNNSATPSLAIPVSGTGVAPASHEVVFSWSASSSAVIGYDTYRGTTSGGPYTKLTSSPISQTSYTDQDVTGGDTYYYVVTSIGTDEVESAFSNVAKAVIPSP